MLTEEQFKKLYWGLLANVQGHLIPGSSDVLYEKRAVLNYIGSQCEHLYATKINAQGEIEYLKVNLEE